jgi:formylglycine-generating enzyme required for sulfatase activity
MINTGKIKKIIGFVFLVFFFIGFSHADEQPNLTSLLEASRKGDVEAMCDTGIAYFYGKETLKDPFKAKCWIYKAYSSGSLRAEKIWQDLELWKYSGKCEASFDDEPLPKYSRKDIFKEPVTGMEFVYIPKDCFKMGCNSLEEKCRKEEMPYHNVCLDGFWMGKYEVTQKQWRYLMGENPSRFNSDSSRPVENVSFDDIQEFIRILRTKGTGKFSLPTEAQWEYACRNGGKKVIFFWGNESYRPDANCGTCDSEKFYGETAPVGSFFPNELGLYDMAGNVKEWCQDIYYKKTYSKRVKENPVYEGKGSSRVVRGGSFADNTSILRCAGRDNSIPGMRTARIGFRLVMTRDN